MSVLSELRRGALWKALSVYVASAWGVVGVVDFVTDQAGLPDWTPTMAVLLALLGLPMVAATVMVQASLRRAAQPWPAEARDEETFAEDESVASVPGARIFTWSNTLRGGVVAATVFVAAVGGYVVSWTTGIGPVGSLSAQGVLEAGDPVLLADFENRTDDADLGSTVTEALRVDLSSSQQIALVDPSQVELILGLMQREPDTAVRDEVAEEIAVRGGIKAIVEGSVGSAGSGFIVSAAIRESSSGRIVANMRRTAGSPDELVAAIDKLSQDIRERAGESLRTIRAETPLDEVTTASLEALELYAAAVGLHSEGRTLEGIEKLDDALELDPEFAMAWRLLAVELNNLGLDVARAREAATRAFELSDRLTRRERLLAEAYWASRVSGDPVRGVRAYEEVLELHPDDPSALNNLAIEYGNFGRYEDALGLMDRAAFGPAATRSVLYNRAQMYVGVRRLDEARSALALARERYPEQNELFPLYSGAVVSGAAQDWEAFATTVDAMYGLPSIDDDDRHGFPVWSALEDGARGRVSSARTGLRTVLDGARRDYPWLVQGLTSRWFALESLYDRDAFAALAGEVLRVDVANGWIQGPDLFFLTFVLIEAGYDDAVGAIMEEVAAQMEGVPAAEFLEPLVDGVNATLARAEDPRGAIARLEQAESRIGCEACFVRMRALAAIEAGDFELAADLYASPHALLFERQMAIIGIPEAQLREAEAAEAGGLTDRAVRLYRSLIDRMDDPDAVGAAFIADLEARIARLEAG